MLATAKDRIKPIQWRFELRQILNPVDDPGPCGDTEQPVSLPQPRKAPPQSDCVLAPISFPSVWLSFVLPNALFVQGYSRADRQQIWCDGVLLRSIWYVLS